MYVNLPSTSDSSGMLKLLNLLSDSSALANAKQQLQEMVDTTSKMDASIEANRALEKQLKDEQDTLAQREQSLSDAEAAFDKNKQDVQAQLDSWKAELTEREVAVSKSESILGDKLQAFEKADKELSEKTVAMASREDALNTYERSIYSRECVVGSLEKKYEDMINQLKGIVS